MSEQRPYILLADQTDVLALSQSERQAKLDLLQQTPFDAVTVLPSINISAEWMVSLQSAKPFLPWVYLHSAFPNWPTFDLTNEHGGITAWLNIWRIALEVAQELGAPGVIFDLEFYPNYDWGQLTQVVNLTSMEPEEVICCLANVGSQFADVVDAVFPTALIWGLVTPVCESEAFRTQFHLTRGMLQRMRENSSRATLIAGGSTEVKYPLPTLTSLQSRSSAYLAGGTDVLRAYPNLRLGAPFTLWPDKGSVESWLADWMQTHPECSFNNTADFYPAVNYLCEYYSHWWLYNHPAASRYDPFGTNAAAVHRLLRSAKARQRITLRAECGDYDIGAALAEFDADFAAGLNIQQSEI